MKRTIINIAIILTLVLGLNIVTAAPAAAATTHYVFPLQLTTKNADSTAEWSTTEARTGSSSIHLDTGTTTVGDGDEARIVVPMPAGTVLNDLNSISWWEYLLAGYPPHVDIQIDIDGNGTADDALVFEYAYNSETHYGEAPMPYGALTGAWYQTFGDDGNGPAVIDDSANAWLSSGPPGPPGDPGFIYGTLAEWKAGAVDGSIDGNTAVISLEIELDNWVVDSEAYVDDITVNGVTYYGLIQEAIDAASPGDTVNVAAGTYTEAINIDKSLTLLGATWNVNKNGYAVPANYAWDDTAETIIQHPNPGSGYTTIVNIEDVDNVTFQGFIVQELNAVGNLNSSLVRVYAHTQEISNVVVRNNIIGPNTNTTSQDGAQGRMGLYLVNHPYSDQFGIVDSAFSGNKIFGCEGNGNNVFIWSSYYAYGASGPASMAGTVIEDNEIYGSHRSGIETAGGFADLVISNNEIYGNYKLPGDTPDLKYGNGILMIRGSSDKTDTNGYGPVNVTLQDNDIHDNDGHGIYMGPNNNSVTLTGNNIYNNGQDGIIVDLIGNYWNPDFEISPGPYTNLGGSQDIIANYGNIYGNGSYGVRVNGGPTNGFVLDARYNYWGADSGPTHASNPGGTGDTVSDNVDFAPYVGDPGQSDSEDLGPGESGTLSVDGTSVDVQMDGGESGSFGVVEVEGTPGGGYTGMGGGQGIGKTLTVNTTAADGTYLALIQLYYGDVNLAAAGITEDDLRLYYDDGGVWKLAVEGNVSPPDNDIRWEVGTPPALPLADADLGRHGIDTGAKILWAVVNHTTDYSGGVGPVEAWVDDDYTPATPGWHVDHFDNIQDAIDTSASGATIHVAEGTYNENPVVNKANMTITASGAAVNTVIQPGAGVGIDVQPGGAGLTLDGFTIVSGAGTTFLVQLTNGLTDVTINDNDFDTTGDASMGVSVGAVGATDLAITGNTFTGDSGDGLIWGPNVVDVTVTGNTFTGAGLVAYGVQFCGITGTSVISDNTFTDIVGSGAIVISNGTGTSGLSITDNEITGCTNGIRFAEYAGYGAAANMTTVTITDNTLTGNGAAIRVGDGAHVLASNFFIEYNYISGSTGYGLQNEHATEVVTAMKNWWGANTGPTHPTNPLGLGDVITDNVIYQPWLDNADQPEDSSDDYIDAIADASTEVFIYNAGGGHVVSAGRWSHNPDGAYPTFMVVGGYFIDVVVEDDTGFDATTEIEIRFHYDDADVDAGLIESTFRMKWWDGTAWLDCSDSGVNTAGNYVWVKIRATGTSPTLADMNGTPFAASGQRVVIPGLTSWGTLALAVLLLAAVVWTVRRRKKAAVRVQD